MMSTEPTERPSISTILNSKLLREHDSGYRQWNKKLYPFFRNLTGCSNHLKRRFSVISR
jgi:hypothetical protein